MPIHRGMSSAVALPPVVTTSAVQQFNQNRASLVCLVSANDYATTVTFQYNRTNDWSSYVTVSAGTTIGQNQSMYSNVSNLWNGETYYVRAVATSEIGTVIGEVVSFKTWSLKTYLQTTAGGFSVNVPSITPIGEATISPTIYEMIIYGGGGSAAYGGGGGGGYRLFSSHLSSVAGSQTINGTVGAGGPYNSATAQPGPSGGSSTITIGGTSWTAGGGTGGGWLTSFAGSVGTGNNPSYGGGVGYHGYTYISGYNQWTDPSCGCCAADKFGNCTGWCSCNNPNSPIYTTDYNRYAGGGGGGTDGGGGNAGYPDVGGNGGPGGGAYGLRGGNGGGGGGTAAWGSAGSVPSGSGPIVGTGGTGWWNAGVAGGVTFKYYGP